MSEDVFQFTVEFHIQGDINTKELKSNLSGISTQLIRDYLEHKRFVSLLNYGTPYYVIFLTGLILLLNFFFNILVIDLFFLFAYGLIGSMGAVLIGIWWRYLTRYKQHFEELQGIKILPMPQEDRSDRSELKYKKVKFIIWKEKV